VALPRGSGREIAEAAALAEPNVVRALGERSIRRVIYVPDKLVNLVV
jgi:leucyl-tRNA synthetase